MGLEDDLRDLEFEVLRTASTSSGYAANTAPLFAPWNLSLQGFLGSGSFGYVFKAMNEVKSPSAVKVIFLDTVGKSALELDQERARVSREYHLIQGKNHRNVLQIINSTNSNFTVDDFEQIRNLSCLENKEEVEDFLDIQCTRAKRKSIPVFCIQMELCSKTLRQWLSVQSEKTPRWSKLRYQIIQDLATGLNYLHENNIMHRDFRPENLMFSYSPTEEFALPIKIGDFGLCREVHSEHSRTSTLTPGVGNIRGAVNK